MSDKTRRCAVLQKFLTASCESRQEVFQKHGSTSLRAVELLPLYGDQILQFGQRTKGILINKLSLDYIYRFPIMWNYERDINHKRYIKNSGNTDSCIYSTIWGPSWNCYDARRVLLCKKHLYGNDFYFLCATESHLWICVTRNDCEVVNHKMQTQAFSVFPL